MVYSEIGPAVLRGEDIVGGQEEVSPTKENRPFFSMVSTLMNLGGWALELVRDDFGGLNTRFQLLALDASIAGKNISRLITTGKITRSTQMSSFALAPAAAFVIPAAQVDQPVEAYIDCEEGVGIDAITLHPDGGTLNGGVYCSDNEGVIHPAILKCKVVVEGGHYVGEGPDICWDDNQPLGLNFEPFTRNGPLYSPAPIVPPASPTAPQPPMEQQSITPEVGGKPSISLDNMDKRGKNALKASAGLIAASTLLFIAGVASRILTGGRPGTGAGKVSVTSEYPPHPDERLKREPETAPHSINDRKGVQIDFYKDYAERWGRVFTLLERLYKPTKRPDEKDN